MCCNSYISTSSSTPEEEVKCGTLDLTPCLQEVQLVKNYLMEAYRMLPKIQYRVWSRINVDDRWGDIHNDKFYLSPILLNSEFQWDRHIKEFHNGKWIRTSKTEMYLLEAQTSLFGITPKEGDTIFLVDRWVEVLSVNKSELIQGTTHWLKWHLIVDTVQSSEG